MTYGVEAVIPLETSFPTLKTSAFTSNGNDELLKKSLDLVEEQRENAMVQLAYYQHKLKQGYDMNGRTLLLDSGFPMLLSRIMAFNSIVKPSGNIVLICV